MSNNDSDNSREWAAQAYALLKKRQEEQKLEDQKLEEKKLEELMHGKTSPVHHNNTDLFLNLPNPLTATRYHSLLIELASMPDCLEITARTKDEEIMGIKHKKYNVHGVQFHPESIKTPIGMKILKNFINYKVK